MMRRSRKVASQPRQHTLTAMNLLVRALAVFLGLIFKRRSLGLLDESVLAFRVWPNDLDANVHMNNGRYLTLMDLGRLDLTARAGFLGTALRRGWRPMVGSATIRFRRGLAPFARFQLITRIVCLDGKWFFIEQRLEAQGQ